MYFALGFIVLFDLCFRVCLFVDAFRFYMYCFVFFVMCLNLVCIKFVSQGFVGKH